MGSDPDTLAFYTREASSYAEATADEKRSPVLAQFAALLPGDARVLDFGCGSGWAAGQFQSLGFDVAGFDGSEGLALEAKERYGIDVSIGVFSEFVAVDAFDAIWASFCLLHDTREAMPGNLKRLAAALRTDGYLYVGLKEGEGMERDTLGRRYTYFSQPEMRGLLRDAGFSVLSMTTEPSVGFDGSPCTSLHIFAQRA